VLERQLAGPVDRAVPAIIAVEIVAGAHFHNWTAFAGVATQAESRAAGC
jgi:hypothetical protein